MLIVVAVIVTVVLAFFLPSTNKPGNVLISTNDNAMNVTNGGDVLNIDAESDDEGAGSMNASISNGNVDASNDAGQSDANMGNNGTSDNGNGADANSDGDNAGNGGSSMSVTDITDKDKQTVDDALSSITAITGNASSYDTEKLNDVAGEYLASVDDIPSGYRTFTNYAYRIMSNLETPENIAFNGEHRKFISAGKMTAATIGNDGAVYTVDVTYDITYTPLSDEDEVRTERKTINETIRINLNGKIYSIEDNI